MILIAFILFILCFLIVWWIAISIGGFFGNLLNDEKGKEIGKAIPFWLGVTLIAFVVGTPILSYGHFSYLCHKNSGQKIYKTIEQWKKENPNIWENLQEISWKNVRYGDIPEYYKKHNVPQFRNFNGKKYELSKGSNQRILDYGRSVELWNKIILHNHHIFYDSLKNEIVMEHHYYRYSRGLLSSLSCGENNISIHEFSNR